MLLLLDKYVAKLRTIGVSRKYIVSVRFSGPFCHWPRARTEAGIRGFRDGRTVITSFIDILISAIGPFKLFLWYHRR